MKPYFTPAGRAAPPAVHAELMQQLQGRAVVAAGYVRELRHRCGERLPCHAVRATCHAMLS
eukprot:355120-Chlamydomonas_euryale.AAC.4